MPIDSIANLRHLSQAQGSFVRLDQGTYISERVGKPH